MNTNRRGWVKNAIIVFLLIMLALTFFSNTIMNYSLPEVAAQYTQTGSITSKIRTSASVKANSTHKITIDESRTILGVAVKDGDMVSQGDVLFYLEDAESSQLKSARETLASLEKQYKLKQLESGVDYYSDELAIKQKQDELDKAREALSKLENNAANIEGLAAELERLTEQKNQLTAEQKQIATDQKLLQKQLTALNNQIAKLQGQAADVSLDGETTAQRIAAATAKYDETMKAYEAATSLKESTAAALEAAEEAYLKAAEEYESLSSSGGSVASITEQIADLNKKIKRYKEDYEYALKELQDVLDAAEDEWIDADYKYYCALELYNQGVGNLDAVHEYEALSEAAYEKYKSLLDSQEKPREEKKRQYDRDMEDFNEQLEKLEKQLKNIESSEQAKKTLDAATKQKKTAETNSNTAAQDFEQKQKEFTEAKAELKSLERLEQLEECEASVEAINEQIEALTEKNDALNEAQKDLETDYNKKSAEKTELEKAEQEKAKNIESQKEVIKNLEQDITTLRHNLAKKKEENSLKNQRDQLEMDELIQKIDEQKELIAKYEANSVDAKITADIAGQVTSISAVAGSETNMGQTLCEIVATELGYSCEINLTSEQAKRVRVGDEVTVSNNWWSNIKANVAAIRNDPKNPGSNKIATISLSGDVVVGQSLNLTIGEKGQTYDSVVPNSAVREDNNGKFILAVESKSSPLGNRYIAKRIDVQVIASDDTNSAVSGVMGGEFIITTSTKPISAGMQVRMADNSK